MASDEALNLSSKTDVDTEKANISQPNRSISDEVEEYERLFKDRYSDTDDYFQCSISQQVIPPPVVHPWYSRPKRNFDYAKVQFNRRSNSGWWNNRDRNSHGYNNNRDHHSNGGERRFDRGQKRSHDYRRHERF